MAAPGKPREQRFVFGEVAELYHRVRPGYPVTVIDAVIAAGRVARPRVVEIGSGTGKASELLAPSCASLICVEPSAEMADIARRALHNLPGSEVITSTFEAWVPAPGLAGSINMVVSAQAWHWVDQAVAIPKVCDLLQPAGALALFWNRPLPPEAEVHEAIQRVYAERAPELKSKRPWEIRVGDDVEGLRKSGAFTAIDESTYAHAVTYATADYLDLMRTQSDHRLMDRSRHENLLAGLADVIEARGGRITIGYTTVLVIARRP